MLERTYDNSENVSRKPDIKMSTKGIYIDSTKNMDRFVNNNVLYENAGIKALVKKGELHNRSGDNKFQDWHPNDETIFSELFNLDSRFFG